MVNTTFIQPQPVNARDARQGFVARFDNFEEAMGFWKAQDTVAQAEALDPLVTTAALGMASGTPEGTVAGALSAEMLSRIGYNSCGLNLSLAGVDWTVEGPAGVVSFTDGVEGMAAVVVDGQGYRQVAIAPNSNGILFQEYRP